MNNPLLVPELLACKPPRGVPGSDAMTTALHILAGAPTSHSTLPNQCAPPPLAVGPARGQVGWSSLSHEGS